MEKKTFFRKAATVLLPASVLLAACAGDTSGNVPAPTEGGEPHIEAVYYANGNRTLQYKNDDGVMADIFQTCDGRDLVEQSEFLKYGYGAAGNSISRSVGHAACVDGVLTPEDFAVQVEG